MERVDSLLQELAARHRNHDPAFLTAVRPLVATIVDKATPALARRGLLELLAETFERDRQIRTDCERTRASWAAFVDAILRLLRHGA
jgi:hypothetical protein